jgi:hypothetical protein
MIYRRRRLKSSAPGGFYRFESTRSKSTVFGFGEGDFVRLRDEYGRIWNGTAEKMSDNTIRFRFRDSEGNMISGISDTFGIVLRDEHGNVWRGLVD